MASQKFTKADLINDLTKRLDIPEKDVEILYHELIIELQEAMALNKKVKISSLGTFYSRYDEKKKLYKPKLRISKTIDSALNT